MALLSQNASGRRADPVVARSHNVGATTVSSVSRQQGSSLAGQKASSNLDNPVSSVTSSVPSPVSNSIPTSITLPTRPVVISTASSPITSIGTHLQPADRASSPANVQSTISDFLSSPFSTISYPDPTPLIVSSSPALSSSLLTVTTGSVVVSKTPDILNVISPTSSAVQDTQTPPTSDIPSSAPKATTLVADTRSPLAPTTTLSGQPPQLTRTPLPSDEVLSLSTASLLAVTSSFIDISLPTSPVATSIGNEIGGGLSHIPKSSSVQSPSGLPGGDALGTGRVEGPTKVLDAPSSAISAPGVLLAATTDRTQTTATLNSTTTTLTPPPDEALTPTSSSTKGVTKTDGSSAGSPTTSPGVPVDPLVSNSKVTDATSISPTVTVATSSVAEFLSSSTDTTLTTATPDSDASPSDGDVFTFSAPFTSATSLGSAINTIPATVPTIRPSAITSVDSSITFGPSNFNIDDEDETSLTESAFVAGSAGDGFTRSSVTITTTVASSSFVEVSGTSSLTFVTKTTTMVVPTTVPASPNPPKRFFPIAAIAASASVVVVLILLVLGFWCYRRRHHVRRASHHAFDFSQTPGTHEEFVPQSELPTFPTRLPTQGPRGWNDPPAAAFASAESANDPFADPVSTNAFRPSIESFNTRPIRRVSMADPFADPPVVMFSSQREAPSWYDVRDARASVTFSNVGRAV